MFDFIVYKVGPATGFGHWELDEPVAGDSAADFEEIDYEDWDPWSARWVGDPEQIPQWSFICNGPGLLVIEDTDDYCASLHATQGGRVLPLSGAASGFEVILPRDGLSLDEKASQGLAADHRHPVFTAGDQGFSRVNELPGEVFCVEWDLNEPNTPERELIDMQFPDWYRASGSSGLHLTEIFHSKS